MEKPCPGKGVKAWKTRKMMKGKDGKAMPRKGGKSLENQKNDEGEGWKSHAQERG